jgi:hypothetical protein
MSCPADCLQRRDLARRKPELTRHFSNAQAKPLASFGKHLACTRPNLCLQFSSITLKFFSHSNSSRCHSYFPLRNAWASGESGKVFLSCSS